MSAITFCSDFGVQEDKIRHCFHFLLIYLSWSDGTGCHDLGFLNVEFQASFFTLLFHLHQEALQFLSSWLLSWWRICLHCRKLWFESWVGRIPWIRDKLPTPVFLDFSGGSAGKESACNAGDLGSIPELGRSPGEGKDYSLQNSGLEIYTGCIVQGVTKSRTWLRNFHCSRLMNQTFMIETPEIPLIPILFTRLQGPQCR